MLLGLGQSLEVEEGCWVALGCCLVQQWLEVASDPEVSQDHLGGCDRGGLDHVRGGLDRARWVLDHPSRCRMIRVGSAGKMETYGSGLQPRGSKHPPLQVLGGCGTPGHLERDSGWMMKLPHKAQPSSDQLRFCWDFERWERKRSAAELLLQASQEEDLESRHLCRAVRAGLMMKKCAE